MPTPIETLMFDPRKYKSTKILGFKPTPDEVLVCDLQRFRIIPAPQPVNTDAGILWGGDTVE